MIIADYIIKRFKEVNWTSEGDNITWHIKYLDNNIDVSLHKSASLSEFKLKANQMIADKLDFEYRILISRAEYFKKLIEEGDFLI